MTESIKQEIINNIFENGDKLITGPILQTVLIDMIDDVNVKDQAILSKTGSWDDAATQIPNLATKAEVTNLSESVARDLENVDVDLTGYATEQWVQNQGYLKEHQDLSDYATKVYVNEAKSTLESNLNNLSSSVSNDIQNKGEEVKTWVQDQGYLKEHQDISGLATKTELTEAKDNLQGNITSLSESVARDLANVSVPEGVATEAWVQSQDYASKSYVDSAVSSSSVDLTGYATETWVQNQGYLKEHQDISGLATKAELTSVSESVQTDISNLATKGELNEAKNNLQGNITSLSESVARDLANVDVDLTGYATEQWVQSQGYLTEHQNISGLATKTELTSVSESVQTDITNLSESVASSAVWKKGTGKDSAVLILTGDDEASTPSATGTGSIAIGLYTTASGDNSHAEGQNTNASGNCSHAEGDSTNASGLWSHAEGSLTTASGDYSHAEGDSTNASDQASHAEGQYTTASGYVSHAEGAYTEASGMGSHAEGLGTITTNVAEHAQGMFNHSSENQNQIFSIGVGEGDPSDPSTVTRKNAIAVLNNGRLTGSFFVQNIGGYDGTNPEPGTNDLATVINNLSPGGGSSSGGSSETLWKKGTGINSIVQKIADGTDQPTASGERAIATGNYTKASGSASHAEGIGTTASGESSHAEGYNTKASGRGSHAEGWGTEASGTNSHAEGDYTIASGSYSHAEGYGSVASGQTSHAEGDHTIASNDNEHAQGQYNHSSKNQIFSVGAGETINGTVTRRNAISILAVPNKMVLTSSVFVQNVGGYDGTNPEPGTNDLATVINNLPSGEGSSETLWKKGTGQDSIVQKVTSISLTEPIASGVGAAAIGDKTKASGWSSHAEGGWTEAKGNRSHAEGSHTTASGEGSHAEGYFVVASNNYEHAQGLWNHTSSNQIFSIGAGDGDPSNPESATRRNAVSVLAVNNSGSYTSSIFVQNIGGYDGTNPEPGTNDLATVINGLSSSGGSSETLWKKGEGTDSIVQVVADGYHSPIATGTRAIAVGEYAKASGWSSHAEGVGTKASGDGSHAEGNYTIASGYESHAEGDWSKAEGNYSHAEGNHTTASREWSHAEGLKTVASNQFEHAQGRFNHNSENQIFSIGTGNSDTDRRNAVSVLEVDNSGSYTSSLFVQNIGGYDGTNPLPGTNDLATVLNNTETWTFTLEDGTTVTKTIRIS